MIDQNNNKTKEELPNSVETLYLNDSFDPAVVSNTLHLSENFSLSNYEDDDDDSGFCCPCCLPR